MRLLFMSLLLFASAGCIEAQQLPASPSLSTPAANKEDLHEKAVELVKLMGIRQRLVDTLESNIQKGKEAMLKNNTKYDPAFYEEWAKRMQARTNIDDYVNVWVGVYEKHLNGVELSEMIQAQTEYNKTKQFSLPTPLKDKLTSSAIAMQSEVMGGCSQVGAKLGGEIGQEIEKEHPDWVKQTKPIDKTAPTR